MSYFVPQLSTYKKNPGSAPNLHNRNFAPGQWTPLGSPTSDPMSSLIRSLAPLFQQTFPRYWQCQCGAINIGLTLRLP